MSDRTADTGACNLNDFLHDDAAQDISGEAIALLPLAYDKNTRRATRQPQMRPTRLLGYLGTRVVYTRFHRGKLGGTIQHGQQDPY